jgi:arsenate reductase
MAEALWDSLGEGEWESVSAGSKPAGYVHPLAIGAMRELGIDLSQHQSKSVNQFQDQPFDLVVTVCDNAREACPVFPGAAKTLHWPFEDPAYADGTDEERMQAFRRIRDQIRDRIQQFLTHGE